MHGIRFGFLGVLFLISTLGWAQSSGSDLFNANCASCHQANGQGIPGAFPPLAGHVGDLYAAEGGKQHLINVLLFGIQGPITVNGQEYNGLMPSQAHLSDEDIAAVLDHILTAWGDADELEAYTPVTSEEVAASRDAALSPQEVHQQRPEPIEDSEGSEVDSETLPLATFTLEQIERIQSTYNRRCADCHGESFTGGVIGGPPLTGQYFDDRWGGQSVASLYTYTSSRMPLDRPGSLTAQQYADLVALILSVNGHEAGETELPSDPAELEGVGIKED